MRAKLQYKVRPKYAFKNYVPESRFMNWHQFDQINILTSVKSNPQLTSCPPSHSTKLPLLRPPSFSSLRIPYKDDIIILGRHCNVRQPSRKLSMESILSVQSVHLLPQMVSSQENTVPIDPTLMEEGGHMAAGREVFDPAAAKERAKRELAGLSEDELLREREKCRKEYAGLMMDSEWLTQKGEQRIVEMGNRVLAINELLDPARPSQLLEQAGPYTMLQQLRILGEKGPTQLPGQTKVDKVLDLLMSIDQEHIKQLVKTPFYNKRGEYQVSLFKDGWADSTVHIHQTRDLESYLTVVGRALQQEDESYQGCVRRLTGCQAIHLPLLETSLPTVKKELALAVQDGFPVFIVTKSRRHYRVLDFLQVKRKMSSQPSLMYRVSSLNNQEHYWIQHDKIAEDIECWLIIKYKPGTRSSTLQLAKGSNHWQLQLPGMGNLQVSIACEGGCQMSIYKMSSKAFWAKLGNSLVQARSQSELRMQPGTYFFMIEAVGPGVLSLASADRFEVKSRSTEEKTAGGRSWRNAGAISKS